jgi:hypothetical protein
MAQPVRPLVVCMREQLQPHVDAALTAARDLRESGRARSDKVVTAANALLDGAALLLDCAQQMEARHFAAMMASATQPAMRAFDGEPLLGATVVRRVATARASGRRRAPGVPASSRPGVAKPRAPRRRSRTVAPPAV